MNRLTATKTKPVTQNVRWIVSSIAPQLEAIGVKYQGLRKWNRTAPTTNKNNTIAMLIPYYPLHNLNVSYELM